MGVTRRRGRGAAHGNNSCQKLRSGAGSGMAASAPWEPQRPASPRPHRRASKQQPLFPETPTGVLTGQARLTPHRRRFSFREYDGNSDLHVGISSTRGVVYNYNEEGIHRDETGWEQCISIPLVQPDMSELLQHWDHLLEEFSMGEEWLPHRYEEHDHNCYTYALAFINSILTVQGKQQMSKSEFTEKFVIPQTKNASKYITLHQELTTKDFYIVPLPDQEKQC